MVRMSDQDNKAVGKEMWSSESQLHPLFSSLKDLSSAVCDSTFLAIAHIDD